MRGLTPTARETLLRSVEGRMLLAIVPIAVAGHLLHRHRNNHAGRH